MRAFICSIKLFFKTPSVVVAYLLMLGINNVVLYRLYNTFLASKVLGSSYVTSSFFYFLDIEFFSVITFILWMFIGFEYMRKSYDVNMIECIRFHCGKVKTILGSQCCTLLLMSAFVSINIGVYIFLGYKNLNSFDMPLKDVVNFYVWDIVVMSISACALGAIVSKLKNRMIGYAAIILIVGLTIPQLSGFWNDFQNMYKIPVFGLIDLINPISNNSTSVPDPLYGLSVERFRKFAMVFILIVASFTLIYPALKKKSSQIFVLIGTIIFVGFCAFNIYDKGSVLVSGDAPYSSLSDMRKYAYEEVKSRDEKNNFDVTKYTMEFNLDKELAAKVDMNIQMHENSEELKFTLYHGYKIHHVTDGKQSMNYEREGDYISIQTNHSKIDTIHMEYKGASPMFYSNERAAFLPQMFAYYPRAGFQSIYDDNLKLTNYQSEASDYDVRVKGPDSVSNLKGKDNHFTGKATGFTLVAGCVGEKVKDNTRVIAYPLDRDSFNVGKFSDREDLQEELNQINDFLGTDVQFDNDNKTIISIPENLAFNSNMKTIYDCEDCIFFNKSLSGWDVIEAELDKHNGKINLKDALLSIQPDSDTELDESLYSDDKDMSEEEYTDQMRVYDLYVTKMREHGVKEVSQRVIKYLLDDSNEEDEIHFLNSIV